MAAKSRTRNPVAPARSETGEQGYVYSERGPGPDAALAEDPDGPLVEELTPRELEVLELVSLGLSNKAIGQRLGISEHTVKFHVSSICGKLGVSGRTAAVRAGIRRGLVTL